MSSNNDFFLAVKGLVEHYDGDAASTRSDSLHISGNMTNVQVVSVSESNSTGLAYPTSLPRQTGLVMSNMAYPHLNIYASGYNMNFGSSSESGHNMAEEADAAQHPYYSSSPMTFPFVAGPQSPGILEVHNNNGHATDSTNHHDVQSPPASVNLDAGTIRHDELFPNHWMEDQTQVKRSSRLFERVAPGLNGKKPTIEYRVERASNSGGNASVHEEPVVWMDNGRTVVNTGGTALRFSPYLPQTVSTMIEGWRMVLIMKHDPTVIDQDFIDRMPIDSDLHQRRQSSTLRTRRRAAREKYDFQELGGIATFEHNDTD